MHNKDNKYIYIEQKLVYHTIDYPEKLFIHKNRYSETKIDGSKFLKITITNPLEDFTQDLKKFIRDENKL